MRPGARGRRGRGARGADIQEHFLHVAHHRAAVPPAHPHGARRLPELKDVLSGRQRAGGRAGQAPLASARRLRSRWRPDPRRPRPGRGVSAAGRSDPERRTRGLLSVGAFTSVKLAGFLHAQVGQSQCGMTGHLLDLQLDAPPQDCLTGGDVRQRLLQEHGHRRVSARQPQPDLRAAGHADPRGGDKVNTGRRARVRRDERTLGRPSIRPLPRRRLARASASGRR